jgi:cyclopropane-fatty-acyl-phospholipid synthase
MLDQLLLNRLRARLEQAQQPLAIRLWNGEEVRHGEAPSVTLDLKRPQALKALADPSLGALARAYVEEDLDLLGETRDILALGERYCGMAGDCEENKAGSAWQWWRHTRTRDRKNIQYHYDVSNDFYGLWLDARRVYSCAYFQHPGQSLEDAQVAKLDHICKKLALQPGERFLDVGCGWGGLVLHAAEQYGVQAVGITLSDNQYEHVQAQIAARGLQGRVEVRLMDYRDVPEAGGFDKIASVGMFEHVGRGKLPAYFSQLFSLLKPGGLVLNHGITSAALDSQGLGSGISDFIDDYVFPGGELVHASEVLRQAASAGLECLDAENLRPHYAHTLWHWVDRLEARAEMARQLIGEQKYRIWRIYMAGSAHAFARGWLELWQVLAGRAAAPGQQPNYPFQRAYIYR